MPLVTVLNLRREDRLADLEEAITRTLTSMPELAINDWEVNIVPVLMPDGFRGEVTRINIELWERPERTKDALQELATRAAPPAGWAASLTVSKSLSLIEISPTENRESH
jgi:hypothetical protein